MERLLKHSKISFLIFWMACFLPGLAFGIGFGEIKLNSYLNEPLDAEIELLGTESYDADRLMVSLASAQEFKRAGLDRPFFLSQLRFAVDRSNKRTIIKIASKDPIKQPYLDFLIDLTWPGGRLVRGYTVLLDPAPITGPALHEKRSRQENTQEDPKAVVLYGNAGAANLASTSKQNLETLFDPDFKDPVDQTPTPMTVVTRNDKTKEVLAGAGTGQVISKTSDGERTVIPAPPVTLNAPTPSLTPEAILQVNVNGKQILWVGGGILLAIGFAVVLWFLLRLLFRRKHHAKTMEEPNNDILRMFMQPGMQTGMMDASGRSSAGMNLGGTAAPLGAHLSGNMSNPLGSVASFLQNPHLQAMGASEQNSVFQQNAALQQNLDAALQMPYQNAEAKIASPFSFELPKTPGAFTNETALKLELVKHYLDIGDRENATPLLENILAEGTEKEKEHAQKLLYNLSLEKL